MSLRDRRPHRSGLSRFLVVFAALVGMLTLSAALPSLDAAASSSSPAVVAVTNVPVTVPAPLLAVAADLAADAALATGEFGPPVCDEHCRAAGAAIIALCLAAVGLLALAITVARRRGLATRVPRPPRALRAATVAFPVWQRPRLEELSILRI